MGTLFTEFSPPARPSLVSSIKEGGAAAATGSDVAADKLAAVDGCIG